MTDYRHVPETLKRLRQWVCYRVVERDNGKLGKIPVDPQTLRDAKANDPSTWGTFEQAVTAADQNGLAGIGIEFANGVFGVDLDGVIDSDGNLRSDAASIVATMDSYTEYSPSGTGLHILCMGSLPAGQRRKGFLEMYDTGRFFTVTGKTYGTPRALAERSAEAARVHALYLSDVETRANASRSPVDGSSVNGGINPPPTDRKPTESLSERNRGIVSDDELLHKMFSSRRGDAIRRLWEGDTSANGGDHSAADLALVRDLAYWTNGDPARIDTLFRSSGLMRDKWDQKRGAQTYGEKTIAQVLKDFRPFVESQPIKRITRGDAVVLDLDERRQDGQRAPSPVESSAPAESDSMGEYVSALAYLNSKFNEDRKQFVGYKQRKTGFSNIDARIPGLYPGLYVIGAVSSLGKTTFVHQLGDQLADAGDTVLFYSLEQSRFELIAKSIARESFKQNPGNDSGAMSAIQVRSGETVSSRARAGATAYRKFAERMIIREGNFQTNVESIRDDVARFIRETGITPIVIVDYLQIIPAVDPRQGDKEKIDQNMKALKLLQREFDLVVFVISALNRANYTAPIAFESFRESSGIEYTADVVWGLQYDLVGRDALFENEKKTGEKRKKLAEEKQRSPRRIELVCLKNRYGADFSVHFDYYSRYDYFSQNTLLDRT